MCSSHTPFSRRCILRAISAFPSTKFDTIWFNFSSEKLKPERFWMALLRVGHFWIFVYAITSRILRILMEHTETKNSLDSKLQTLAICSMKIINILEVIPKTRFSKTPKCSTLAFGHFWLPRSFPFFRRFFLGRAGAFFRVWFLRWNWRWDGVRFWPWEQHNLAFFRRSRFDEFNRRPGFTLFG